MITLDTEDVQKRKARIRNLLSKVARVKGGPAIRQYGGGQQLVIGAADVEQRNQNHTDWRFALAAQKFHGNYYEIWQPVSKTKWCLYRAYFHIYRMDGSTEMQYLCLHCDPTEPNGKAAKYKRGPHLHIGAAGEPFDHAHIALGHQHFSHVLKTMNTLMHAYGSAVQMIEDEILAGYRAPGKRAGDSAAL